jgi:hypothetical protein
VRDNSSCKAANSSPHTFQKPLAARPRQLQELIVSPLLRRRSVFSQRRMQRGVRYDLAGSLEIRGLCLSESWQTAVRSSAAQHAPIPDYVPTIAPLFAHYPSTIWRRRSESNMSLCDSKTLPHRRKSLTDTRILEFPKHFPQIVPKQAHSPEFFHYSVTIHPLLFHY